MEKSIQFASIANICLILTVLFAAWKDWTEWRIPNPLIAGGTSAALMLAAFHYGEVTVQESLLGGIAGILMFLPFYLLRGMGAGDVKLLGVVGLFVGIKSAFSVALISALIGGLWAIVISDLKNGTGPISMLFLKINSKGLWQFSTFSPVREGDLARQKRLSMIPYGVVMALGTIVTLVSIKI